jgi:hypothetical protein
MDLIKKLIDFVMELLGLKPKQQQQLPPSSSGNLSQAEKDQIKDASVQGLEDVDGAENIHVHGTGSDAKVVKSSDGADLIEEDGEQLWVSRINTDVPREKWVDVWGPLAKVPENQRIEEFCFHSRFFDELHQGQPLDAEKKLIELGYKSVGEYYRVMHTLYKYKATPHGPNVGDCVVDSQEYQSAMLKATRRWQDSKQAAVLNANPEMMAPVDGVTVEMYAKIAASIAQQISQPDLMKLLASMNLDLAHWDKANKVWTDRMSKDTTGSIATVYGKAFMNQGQGQFGAASQASAATNWDGSAAAGAEPIPFEKCCEIQGAMSAWSKSGKDVNALLKKHFNMVAMDWSAANTWWLSQLTANLSRFDEYNKKCALYEKKYADSGAASDSDISF